jgi:hypothetical protein
MGKLAPTQTKIELAFEVKSTDRELKTIDGVREALKLSGDLQAALEKKYPDAKLKVKIRRVEGLPVLALVHHIIVSIDWHTVKVGIETAASQFATREFLKLAKKRVRGLFAKPASPPAPPTMKNKVASEPPAIKSPNKKLSARKSTAKTKGKAKS